MVVTQLPLEVDDEDVMNYSIKVGGKPSNQPPQYLNYLDGPMKGYRNGERRYRVDFSGLQTQMGSSHPIKKAKVKIIYRDNFETCGWCHQSASGCPGAQLPPGAGTRVVPISPFKIMSKILIKHWLSLKQKSLQ